MFNSSQIQVTDENQQGNHGFYSNSAILAVILFFSSERFHITYHPFRALIKNCQFYRCCQCSVFVIKIYYNCTK